LRQGQGHEYFSEWCASGRRNIINAFLSNCSCHQKYTSLVLR